MKCPECGMRARILETRTRDDGVIRRRYGCFNEHLFTSLEALVEISETQLHKKHEVIKTRGRVGLSALWFSVQPSSAH